MQAAASSVSDLCLFLERLAIVIQKLTILVHPLPLFDPVRDIPQSVFIEDVAPIDPD